MWRNINFYLCDLLMYALRQPLRQSLDLVHQHELNEHDKYKPNPIRASMLNAILEGFMFREGEELLELSLFASKLVCSAILRITSSTEPMLLLSAARSAVTFTHLFNIMRQCLNGGDGLFIVKNLLAQLRHFACELCFKHWRSKASLAACSACIGILTNGDIVNLMKPSFVPSAVAHLC